MEIILLSGYGQWRDRAGGDIIWLLSPSSRGLRGVGSQPPPPQTQVSWMQWARQPWPVLLGSMMRSRCWRNTTWRRVAGEAGGLGVHSLSAGPSAQKPWSLGFINCGLLTPLNVFQLRVPCGPGLFARHQGSARCHAAGAHKRAGVSRTPGGTSGGSASWWWPHPSTVVADPGAPPQPPPRCFHRCTCGDLTPGGRREACGRAVTRWVRRQKDGAVGNL